MEAPEHWEGHDVPLGWALCGGDGGQLVDPLLRARGVVVADVLGDDALEVPAVQHENVVVLVLEGELVTQLRNGREVVLGRGQSYVVADGDGAHRSRSPQGARLFIQERGDDRRSDEDPGEPEQVATLLRV
jgi:hypothetical protein